MREALLEAHKAKERGEVPIGAIIVNADDQIVTRSHNQVESEYFVGAHAEMIAINSACKQIKNWRLSSYKLFVTLEPCIMCASALMLCRISHIYFGCTDNKIGGCESLLNICNNNQLPHQISIKGGILQNECATLLKDFFKTLRN